MNSRAAVRATGLVSVGFAVLLLVAGVAAADSHTWTSQADFQAGTLTDVNATASPGDLMLTTSPLAFARYSGNPLIAPGASGAWDDLQVVVNSVIKVGSTYHLWYWGCQSITYYSIGHATSSDGLTWTKDPANPVIPDASSPFVMYEGGVFKMWYNNRSVGTGVVDYATSTDGTSWSQYAGNPVLTPGTGWDSYALSPGPVLHNATGYYMWYGATADQMSWDVGLATSPDGTSWTRYSGNPIIVPPFAGSWDAERVIPNAIVPSGSQLVLAYVSADASFTQRIGLTTSADGIHWTPFPTPALDLGPSGSWDGYGLSRMAILNISGNLRMWYSGTDGTYYHVGLALAPAFAQAGSFTSAPVDTGQDGTTWTNLNFSSSNPVGTQVTLALRSGPHAAPDGTWSAWSPEYASNGTPAAPRSRYAQVRATLTSTTSGVTPVLHDVTLGFQLDRVEAPTLIGPITGSWTKNATGLLSWGFQDPDAGDTQAAYELQMSGSSTFVTSVLDTGVVSGSSAAVQLTLPASDGTWYWRVRTEDNWGQWSAFSDAAILHTDRTPPFVSVEWGAPSVLAGGVRYITSGTLITLNATDGAMGIGTAFVLYSVDNGLPSIYSVPFRTNESDGQHFVQYSAVDLLGNIMPPATVSFVLDDTGPTTGLAVSPSGSDYAVSASATDSGSGVAAVYVSVDNGAWSAYTDPVVVGSAGTHTIRAYAVDKLGNHGATESVTIVIANIQPYLAGSIGTIGLLLGLILFRVRKGGAWMPAAMSATFGAIEVAAAVTSAGTGLLAIPPWPSAALALDAALAVGVGVAVVLGWRAKGRGGEAPPPGPPPNP